MQLERPFRHYVDTCSTFKRCQVGYFNIISTLVQHSKTFILFELQHHFKSRSFWHWLVRRLKTVPQFGLLHQRCSAGFFDMIPTPVCHTKTATQFDLRHHFDIRNATPKIFIFEIAIWVYTYLFYFDCDASYCNLSCLVPKLLLVFLSSICAVWKNLVLGRIRTRDLRMWVY